MKILFEDLKKDERIKDYIVRADESLNALGYTEHCFAHVNRVAQVSSYVLEQLGYSEADINLVKIASYLHDIGNLVNRVDHAQSGAVMAFQILNEKGMDSSDLATVVTAIGNHDEGTAVAVNPIAAALILGDKTDVRRTRVRNLEEIKFDIHDRVNYSVFKSDVVVDAKKKTITLNLDIDTKYGSVMDYFEIFLGRMLLCRKASARLGLTFQLVINGQSLL